MSSILDSQALIAVMSRIRVGPYYGLDLVVVYNNLLVIIIIIIIIMRNFLKWPK